MGKTRHLCGCDKQAMKWRSTAFWRDSSALGMVRGPTHETRWTHSWKYHTNGIVLSSAVSRWQTRTMMIFITDILTAVKLRTGAQENDNERSRWMKNVTAATTSRTANLHAKQCSNARAEKEDNRTVAGFVIGWYKCGKNHQPRVRELHRTLHRWWRLEKCSRPNQQETLQSTLPGNTPNTPVCGPKGVQLEMHSNASQSKKYKKRKA